MRILSDTKQAFITCSPTTHLYLGTEDNDCETFTMCLDRVAMRYDIRHHLLLLCIQSTYSARLDDSLPTEAFANMSTIDGMAISKA